MKRILILAFGIMISAGLGVGLSRYTLAFTTNEEVTDRIFEEAGISQATDSTDPTILEDLALSDDHPFKNLYLYMYQNVLNGPEKAAISVLSKQYLNGEKYTQDELENITQKGDTSAILSHKKQRSIDAQSEETVAVAEANQEAADAAFEEFLSNNEDAFSDNTIDYIRSQYETSMRPTVPSESDVSEALTQQVLLDEYNFIMDAYTKELDLQRDNRKLAYESIANEMFLNNDLTDSANIDLLYDLDLAHYVLFGSFITYPDRSGGDDVDLASIEEAVEDYLALQPNETEVVLSAEDTVSPYACFDDEALHAALDAFEEGGSGATGSAPEEEDTFEYPDPEAIAEEVSDDPTIQASAEETVEGVNAGLEEMQNFLLQLNGKKGDWTRSLPCGDVFCITVQLIDENDDPVVSGDYGETDNCVACHVAYINEAMNATLDHSLVAGKVSKNWFEDATCKDAGNQVNLDINVYAVKKSIDLDPGDDIDEAPAKDIEDLKATLSQIGGLPQNGAAQTELGKTRADAECESLLNLNALAGSPQSLSEIQDQCQTISDQIQEEMASVYDQTQMEGLNENQATLYQQVAAELYKMALTFRTFQEQLQATYKGDNAPLPSLLAKKYCE